MHWDIKAKLETSPHSDAFLRLLLANRGLSTSLQIKAFLYPPPPETLSLKNVGLSSRDVDLVISRLKLAISHQSSIVIYGDYDADGITATAILYETLRFMGAKVVPFIPSREEHGYGLSLKGITAALNDLETLNPKPLFITVDNGITAFAAATYLKEQGIDLIITDHHEKSQTLPPAYGIVHSTLISGAGVAWFLSKALLQDKTAEVLKTLDLVTIGTVADMLPLTGPNRAIVKAGLNSLRSTHRLGLKALYQAANLDDQTEITPYHINFLIAPRLNAMGRLEHALDSLRLLCTTNPDRAAALAAKLDQVNFNRQDLTQSLLDQAKSLILDSKSPILILDHPDFHEGIIGLVAGKLVETYTRPAIVIARHQEISKASARSVKGVNIIELIRVHEDLLVNAGGHPMAAGFSIETGNIEIFRSRLTQTALETIDPAHFIPQLEIDCALNADDLSLKLYQSLMVLRPFGIGNPEPVFCTDNVRVLDSRLVGKNQNHLKLTLQSPTGQILHGIGFNLGHLKIGPNPKLAFTLSENTWNGKTTLQLIVKDIHN